MNNRRKQGKNRPDRTAAQGPRIYHGATNRTDTTFVRCTVATDRRFWRWGDDNLFPDALALMSRRSTIHRRIINDKADYISGKGFVTDECSDRVRQLVANVNGTGESMRNFLKKVAFDKCLFGNAFVEIVTDRRRTFLSLFHQDASRCRLSRDRKSIIMHHNWAAFKKDEARVLPIYPSFNEGADGTCRSVIHYKVYEPMFENYGVPSYIAGLNVSAIAYKTDTWNISRLDNSFQMSGIMLLDGTVDSEAEAEQIMKTAQEKFAGKPGQVMFMIKDCAQNDSSRFIPMNTAQEGDWKELHSQATSDIVVAHSWFRSLSGLDYGSGFTSDRILHEYEIALNTVILTVQEELMEPLRRVVSLVFNEDASSLSVINRPPKMSRPSYMKVWEARKADGLEYDAEDPQQQSFLARLGDGQQVNS